MSGAAPLFVAAGEREGGCICPHCAEPIQPGGAIAVCPRCGTVHHRACWEARNRCGAYACAPARVEVNARRAEALKVTAADLDDAVPLPARRAVVTSTPALHPRAGSGRTSGLAIAAFITALAGIPFFGAVTGLVAILLGSLALGGLRGTPRRGAVFAVVGILLGLFDVVGWVVFLGIMLTRPGPEITLNDLQVDPAALENLDPVLNRSMRANVLIESREGRGLLVSEVIGSGVILNLADGQALIVTNGHVVDPNYSGAPDTDKHTARLPPVQVHFIGQASAPGQVVWQAPHGIDLALVRVPCTADAARAALWEPNHPARVGDPVFAIGNPHHLDWTHTQGSISQFRLQRSNGHEFRVIQTQTAINPGNSGGGLYDRAGYLLGINSWTEDKRVSEGLNFAIAIDTLLEQRPPDLKFPAQPAAGDKP